MDKENSFVSRGWLWTTLLVAISGGLTTFYISLDKSDPTTPSSVALALTITIIATGLCLICATANWWLHR